MKKLLEVILFFVFVCSSAQARYVRKVREPDFFIPDQFKMHQQERLPAVDPRFIEKPKIKENKKDKDLFTDVPEYKKKYDEYLADIEVFSKEGIMPKNENLDNDLSLMAEGYIFEVTESVPEKITTQEHKKFEDIVIQILKD